MILQAIEITNNTDTENPVIELITATSLSWNADLFDGNEPIIVGATITAGYQDISSIENFAKWGKMALGKSAGFKDWKCLRSEIKALVLAKTSDDIGTNWASLNAEEQTIACKYLTNLVPTTQFASTITDADERGAIAMNFDLNSTEARKQRYLIMRAYLLGKIGSVSGVAFLDDCIRDTRIFAFLSGIESKAADGVDALLDMVDATSGTKYDTSQADESLKGLRLRSYAVVDGSGDTLDEVCDTLLGIAAGLY